MHSFNTSSITTSFRRLHKAVINKMERFISVKSVQIVEELSVSQTLSPIH